MAGFVLGSDGQVVAAGPFEEVQLYDVEIYDSHRNSVGSYEGATGFKVSGDNDLQIFFEAGQVYYVDGSWASFELKAVDNA